MHLIKIRQCAELFRQIAQILHRTKVAIHGIDGFKSNQFWRIRVVRLQQTAQMIHIIVTENPLGTTVAAHTFDHRRMVQLVRINNQARKQFGQGAQSCVIGNIGTGEQQGGLFAVQIGQF